MKFILSIISSLIALVNNNYTEITPKIPNPTSQITNKVGEFTYKYFTVNTHDQLELYGNWSKKMNLTELAKEKNCEGAINATFYDTNSQPLGLFINSELHKDKEKKNSFMNGYLYKNNKEIQIGNNLPQEPEWAIQTGPILVEDGKPKTLNMTNDKPARRSAAAKINNTLIFIIIFKENSRLDGPTLEELPLIIEEIGRQLQGNIEAAINLDGGSASGYLDSQIYIPEVTYIGSFFCKKSLR